MTRTKRAQSKTPEPASRSTSVTRRLVVIIVALFIGAAVVRNAAVGILAARDPDAAAKLWARHPSTEISRAMTEIARAAREGRPAPGTAVAMLSRTAAREPLAPEPYLVRGISSQLSGDDTTAARAFEQAQWRDPRSLPAAYFLADRYFTNGDLRHGLEQVAVLARLAPSGAATVGPYLATYAADPNHWPVLRTILRENPQLAQLTLIALASNAATVPAVLSLADPRERGPRAQWLSPLLNTLTQAGRYEEARSIWAQRTGVHLRDDQLLYDAAFADSDSPAPFNWDLSSSTVGLAERQPGGRLHVVYYGQEDGFLASQLVLLKPGSYRLSMQLIGDPARAHPLSWSLWCGQSGRPLASVSLDVASARGWRFEVPSGCSAQWLRLSGASLDVAQQSDVTIGGLKLEEVPARG